MEYLHRRAEPITLNFFRRSQPPPPPQAHGPLGRARSPISSVLFPFSLPNPTSPTTTPYVRQVSCHRRHTHTRAHTRRGAKVVSGTLAARTQCTTASRARTPCTRNSRRRVGAHPRGDRFFLGQVLGCALVRRPRSRRTVTLEGWHHRLITSFRLRDTRGVVDTLLLLRNSSSNKGRASTHLAILPHLSAWPSQPRLTTWLRRRPRPPQLPPPQRTEALIKATATSSRMPE